MIGRRLVLAIALTLGGISFASPAAAYVRADRSAPPPVVVANIPVPSTGFAITSGMGAVWLVDQVDANYSTLRKIDPATNKVSGSVGLDSSAGGAVVVGDGSLWVTMYFDSVVERIDARGRVAARIPVGLQPGAEHDAFGSVWVSNHHGRSLSRIDPRTNRVIATIPAGDQHTFRDGPQDLSDDGRYLFVYSSNGDRPFERIDPRTNQFTTYPMTTDGCTSNVALAGSVFIPRCQSSGIVQVDAATGVTRRTIMLPGQAVGLDSARNAAVAYRGDLFAAYPTATDQDTQVGSGGRLADIDPITAAIKKTYDIGGDVSDMTVAAGDLWVADGTNHDVLRIHLP